MIKILDHTKALNLLVNDTTNGLGQFEANSCKITEELNGIYEAEIEMLATDKHFNELSVGGLLQLEVNEAKDKQIFRIYYISKPINQVVQIKAQHITYDLNKIPVKPFTATGAVNAKNGMINNIIGTYPFTMTTDITNNTSVFTLDIPRSFRECLGGYEGSLLDTFRGEYEWDNLTVKMLAHRGSDNGVRISYGKNLTDFTQEENIENVYTSVLGYAVVNEQTYTGNVYHKVQSAYPKVKIVDFSSDYENTTPTTADLTKKAQSYAKNNDIEIPNVNLNISFVPLYQTEEYKNIAPLERVSLGDTVHVYFDKLGVEASARVIKTVWNANLGRYDSIELGNAKANLNTVLNEVQQQSKQEVDTSKGYLEAELNQMATLIINGLGLHRTYVDVAGGGQRMYLHNKPTLAESDTQYVMAANGFLVSTDYGQTWNAGFDAQGNAILNSLATITLKALEIYGANITGTIINFGDMNGSHITAQTTNANDGVIFQGNGKLYMNSTDTVALANYTSSNVIQNSTQLIHQLLSNLLLLTNYKINSNLVANFMQLISNDSMNNLFLQNMNYTNNYIANRFNANSNGSANNMIMQNYEYNSSNIKNEIALSSKASGNTININNDVNAIDMVSNSSGNDITIDNDKNTIEMTSGTSNSIILTNNANVGGRVNTLEMSDSGNFNLYSSDDININAGDRNIVRGKNTLVLQSNDIQLWLGGQQVHLYLDGGVVKYTV